MGPMIEILSGVVLLWLGGEWVGRATVDVARRLGLSELLIAITVVGFGASMPELITSLNAGVNETATATHHARLAIGGRSARLRANSSNPVCL